MRVFPVVLGGLLCAGVCAANPAGALTPPERPAGQHVVSATSTSLTVAATPGPHATSYRAYFSTSRNALWVSHITSRTKRASSSSSTVTARGLAYTALPVYYRMRSWNGHGGRWGSIQQGGLQPATPTSVNVTTTNAAVYLTWHAESSGGFAVTQASDASMSENRTTTIIYGRHYQFTPNLTRNDTYYFQVRARNYGTYSGYSPVLQATMPSSQQTVRALTYNILDASTAGRRVPGGVLPSWAQRRAGVAKLIEQSKADVVAIEEAGGWIGRGGFGGTRQVDSLVRHLPGYRLARTEVPPTEHPYRRYGDYILYRPAAYRPVGDGGVWSLGNDRYAAHQIMQNRTSGARFLYVAVHTIAGHSTKLDAMRRRETETLVRDSTAYAADAGVPVVYGGDFNSAIGAYDVDTPGQVMRAAHIADAGSVAPKRYNATYNSANQYLRRPPLASHCIDYIWAGPGVSVKKWGVLADLKDHRFVGVIPSDHDPVWADVGIAY